MPIQNDKKRNGSALILVVIVTVLLSVIGIIFVMTMRIREMTSSNVTDDRDLDTAVGAVTEKIGTVLRQDLFGTALNSSIINGGGGNESYDSTNSDSWLASLNTSIGIDGFGVPVYYWSQITDLFNNNFGVPTGYYDPQHDADPTDWNGSKPEFRVRPTGVLAKIISEGNRVSVIRLNAANWSEANLWYSGARADADGDGVADSRWFMLPDMYTSRGKPVYAAVRIIDNCAMLNLNTAFGFYQPVGSPWQSTPWSIGTMGANFFYPRNQNNGQEIGRYLSEVNFGPFLRGSDMSRVERIQLARDYKARINSALPSTDPSFCNYGVDPANPNDYPRDFHTLSIMEEDSNFSSFAISDELEIRNRYLLTSLNISRFENSDEDETNDADLYPPYFTGFNPGGRSYIGTAFYTFDFGRGDFVGGWNVGLRSKRIPCVTDTGPDNDLAMWGLRLNPANFDTTSGGDPLCAYYYDRRHLCTFYSFDRNIRTGGYPLLDLAIDDLDLNASALSTAEKRAIESVFRPLDHQPIDLRKMTDPTFAGNIVTPDPSVSDPAGLSYLITTYRNILYLLYALREHFYDDILKWGTVPMAQAQGMAAKEAAQYVANIIDHLDPNGAPTDATGPFQFMGSQKDNNPTYINQSIIDNMIAWVSFFDPSIPTGFFATTTDIKDKGFDFGLDPNDVVYGYECQPFISELYCNYNPSGGAQSFAVELLNPYAAAINLNGWRMTIGTNNYPLTSTFVVPGGTSMTPGRLVIHDGTVAAPSGSQAIATFGLGTVLNGNVLRLQRPRPDVPTRYITVDETDLAQSTFLMSGADGIHVSSRDDSAWKFTNKLAHFEPATPTLGLANGVTAAQEGYQLPMDNANNPLDRFADFQKIAFVGNEPNGITDLIAQAAPPAGKGEREVRYDPMTSLLSGYVSTLGRQEKGIPGRININTAPLHVIAAAIPPQLIMSVGDPNTALDLAQEIIDNRPYTNIKKLLNIGLVKKFASAGSNIGDPAIDDDFEERDWIFNRLSNIFTVRSDTFTAYILVRLGTDGPQRRMLAIFDRSNCWTATDRPRLVALHLVPDPR